MKYEIIQVINDSEVRITSIELLEEVITSEGSYVRATHKFRTVDQYPGDEIIPEMRGGKVN